MLVWPLLELKRYNIMGWSHQPETTESRFDAVLAGEISPLILETHREIGTMPVELQTLPVTQPYDWGLSIAWLRREEGYPVNCVYTANIC